MPDHSHPHPEGFNQDIQLFLIALVHVIRSHLVSIGPRAISQNSVTPRYSTSFFVITPRT